MMTEEEAKTKWCPFVRASGADGEWHTNRPSIADVEAKGFDLCCGSACMAWRWEIAPEEVEPEWGRPNPTGYCGLAGKP